MLSLKKGFTLIELMVVIALIGIMATWSTWSLRSTISYYQQKQAAQILGAAIRSARTSALKSEVTQSSPTYFAPQYFSSTRNAFSVFIYRGRVNPENITETISYDDSDNYEIGYSLLVVNDSGYNTPDRVRCPLQINGSYTSLKAIADIDIRRSIINLPEGIIIKYAGNDESPSGADQSSNILHDQTYFTYDRLGSLSVAMGDPDPFDGLNNITETGLSNKKPYLVIMVAASGSEVPDPDFDPIYVDLRNGNLISVDEGSSFSTIDWPRFDNTQFFDL